MTVKELIELLKKVKDKDIEVHVEVHIETDADDPESMAVLSRAQYSSFSDGSEEVILLLD